MHGVVFTPTFESDARDARLSEDEMMDIVAAIAADPLVGDLMAGTRGGKEASPRRSRQGKARRLPDDPLFRWQGHSGFLARHLRQG